MSVTIPIKQWEKNTVKSKKYYTDFNFLRARNLLTEGNLTLIAANNFIKQQKREQQKEARKVLFAKNTTNKASKVDPRQLPFDFERPTINVGKGTLYFPNGRSETVISGTIYADEGISFIPAVEKELVNHPSHYGGDTPYETIKVMENTLTREEFIGAMKFNIYKYNSRMGKKDSVQLDSDKATFYQKYLNDFLKRTS